MRAMESGGENATHQKLGKIIQPTLMYIEDAVARKKHKQKLQSQAEKDTTPSILEVVHN